MWDNFKAIYVSYEDTYNIEKIIVARKSFSLDFIILFI